MYNPAKIKGFYHKSCRLGLSSNRFKKRNLITGRDLPYGPVPGALRSDGRLYFWSTLMFGRKMLRKSLKCHGRRAM